MHVPLAREYMYTICRVIVRKFGLRDVETTFVLIQQRFRSRNNRVQVRKMSNMLNQSTHIFTELQSPSFPHPLYPLAGCSKQAPQHALDRNEANELTALPSSMTDLSQSTEPSFRPLQSTPYVPSFGRGRQPVLKAKRLVSA